MLPVAGLGNISFPYLCCMIELGNYNTLTVLRSSSVGLFLGDDDVDDLLLPNKYVPADWKVGDRLEVFCYLDHEERPIATTLKPLVRRNQFGYLRVAEVTPYGTFMDWGLEKHLLVPFRQQRSPMVEGQWHVVYCFLDDKSFRLVGSTRLDAFLDNKNLTVAAGDRVDLLVSRQSNLGWDVIVNGLHKGMIFSGDVFKPIAVGDRITGYIREVRENNKLDVVLEPIGRESRISAAEKIHKLLLQEGGFLPLHDKSSPEDIQKVLQMSKKNFKQAIGALYKERIIQIKNDGIYAIPAVKGAGKEGEKSR